MDKTTADPLIGRAISQYEVVARIGGGGMGVVYKATDQKLGRTVALKFLPPQWSHDEGAKQRFLREAQAASATNHRNICIIHDIAQTDDGQLFIVMAYYEGQTLKQKLEAGPLPVVEALEIAAEIAEGLAKAHAQGVVHRDVKPGNLMITDDGVKVLDFGLAKFADSLQLTMAGSTVGTVAYMSPEQARGEEADARSDVWALGVVLYEMLVGRVPFNGAYPEAIFHAIKNEPVPPLSGADREIQPALEMLVLRALEKDPERRYQSAREVARDLRLIQGRTVPLDLRTEPLPLLPGLAASQTLSWPKRVRRAATPARAITALVVMAAVVAGTYAWMMRPVVRIPVAIAPVANHTGEPELDAYRMALTQSLVDEVSDSPNMRVVPYLRLLEIVRRFIGAGDVSSSEAIQAIATQSGASFVIIPSLEYRNGMWLAQAQVRSVETGTVTKTYETEALASSLPKDTALRQMPLLAEQIHAHFKANGPGRSYHLRPASARFRNLDAAKAFEEGLNAYDELEYSSALAAFRRVPAADDQHATAQTWLARVLLVLSQRDEAVAAARKAKQLVTAETPDADVALIEAVLAESQSDSAAAEQHYRAMTGRRPDDLVAKIELADFLKRQSQNQPAIGAYQEALRLDGRYDRLRVDLCQLYVRLDDYPLAEQQARTALEGFRASGHRGGEAQALLCLGDAQRLQGGARLTEARQSIESARMTFESLGEEYGLSRVYFYLGLVAGAEKNFTAAVKYFEEALSRCRRVGNRQTEGIALMNIGVASEILGQRTAVLKYYQESRDLYQLMGDERRAAEQEANAAGLLIDYANQEEGLRRIANARATFEKLGNVEFVVFASEMQAASQINAGRHADARQQLRAARSLAKDRKLSTRVVAMTVRLAKSYFATGEYETARALLEEAAVSEAGRDDLEVAVAMARVQVRLGNFEAARGSLQRVLASIETTGQRSLAPVAHLAVGELEYESGHYREARVSFEKAGEFWTDDLPDAASVEAKCYQGTLDALAGKTSAAVGNLQKSVDHAKRMGRLEVEVQCRLHLARVHFADRRYKDIGPTLDEIPVEGDRTIGSELLAEVHYWRSRAASALGNQREADSEAALSRNLVEALKAQLPASSQEGFASRASIREMVHE